jgi:hypothetical protein
MATITDLKDRYDKLPNDFSLFTAKQYPATTQQIEEYENETGVKFSDDFKDFLSFFGQFILEVKEEIWKRPVQSDVLPMWKFGYGFFVFGLSSNSDVPSWLSYKEKYQETDDEHRKLGQLFFKRSGNLYRAYTNNGVITVEYDQDGYDVEVYNGNLYDFLIEAIDKLENDYKNYINEKNS